MRRLMLGVIVLACSLVGAAFGQEASRDKNRIEWGWDESDAKFIRDNIQQMEELPFDGLIFHVLSRAVVPRTGPKSATACWRSTCICHVLWIWIG
jgi:hypothetical protein